MKVTRGHFSSKQAAQAGAPAGAWDIQAEMVDTFHLETARQQWPEQNPPNYPTLKAAADVDGYVQVWQVTYSIESRAEHPQDAEYH